MGYINKKIIWIIICVILFLILIPIEGISIKNNFKNQTNVAKEIKNINCFFKGDSLYVGGNGPDNYSKIQYAINNASDGDKIFVYSGIYNERVLINKSIDLIGEDKESTVIDGGGKYYVIHIDANNVSVNNFYINNSGIYGTNAGITIYGEIKNITIDNNIITDNYFGICIGDPYLYKRIYYVHITNNLIQNNEFGIGFYEGYETIILNNTFIDNGIFIIKGSTKDNVVKNNTINGLPLVYLEKQSDIIIQQNVGQIILVNCDNITISAHLLTIKCEIGIELLRCTNCNLTNNNISNKYLGIFSFYSDNNNIQGNHIENVTWGIKLDDSDEHIISYNIVNDSRNSIDLEDSNKNKLSYNTLTNSRMGIDLGHSNNNIIFKNEIYGISDNGINLYYECHRNQILNNTIKNCWDAGIFIFGTGRIWWDSACNKNVISGNIIKNNELGIVLDQSALTKIFFNNIIQNDIGVEIRSAKYNKIFKNNIFDNIEEDAILKNSFSSRFDSNFWNETKRVHIIKGGVYRWDFWAYVYYEIFPLLRFDWHAVNEPYDI